MLKKLKIHFHQQDSIKHRGFHLILVFTKPLKDKRRKYFIWYSSSLHRIVMISRWRKECLYWILWTHLYSCFHSHIRYSFLLPVERLDSIFPFYNQIKMNFPHIFHVWRQKKWSPEVSLSWKTISQGFHKNWFLLRS